MRQDVRGSEGPGSVRLGGSPADPGNWRSMVDRRETLTAQEMLEGYVRPGRPVLLTGVTRDWPALSRWNFDFFRSSYGSEPVRISRAARPEEPEFETTLAGYLDSFGHHAEGRPFYLTSWPFRERHPELLEDFRIPECLPEDLVARLPDPVRPDLLWLFMGPAGSGIRMHLDVGFSSAWNVQVTGRKRWVLYPPEQTPFLYEGEVDALHPDLAHFPRFAEARGLELEVGPGELLFIPSLWWHQTVHLEDGIAVTGNFVDEVNWPAVLRYLEMNRLGELREALLRVVREAGLGG